MQIQEGISVKPSIGNFGNWSLLYLEVLGMYVAQSLGRWWHAGSKTWLLDHCVIRSWFGGREIEDIFMVWTGQFPVH